MSKKGGKIYLALIALALCTLLAACQADQQQQLVLVERPETETVIHLFSSSGVFSASNQAKYWSEHFMEETGIQAVIDYEESWYYAQDGQDGRSILRKRIASSHPDDMYIINAEDMLDFARSGYLLDMTDFDFVDNLSDTARQMSTIDGRVYCLPLSYAGFGLYWNVDLLHQYQLEVPQSYSELIDVWDTLQAAGITPYVGNKGYGLTVPAMCLSLAEVYQSPQRDQLLQELASGETPLSTYARQGFAFIQLMCDKGYLDPQQTLATIPLSEEEIKLFQSGQAACVCALMGTEPYRDPQNTGFAVQMTGWPVLADGAISVVGTHQKLCANPASQHPEIVKAFIEMAGSAEALLKCTDDGKVSSGRVNDPAKYWPTERIFDELIQSEGQIPNTDMNLKLNLWEHIRDVSRLIVSGEATVDEACRLLDQRQQQDIAANLAAGAAK